MPFTSPGFRFGLLGPLQVMHGNSLVPITAPKHRVVLTILAINVGRPVSADRIIEELWQGLEPVYARKTLQGYVWRLRRVLGQHLRTRAGSYELYDVWETDAARFERMLLDSRQAMEARHPTLARFRLAAALALWRGPALTDVPTSPMIQAHADRLEEARLLAVEARLQADIELGRHAEVVLELRELTVAHPLREALHALLMLALYRSGRQADALSAYGRLRMTLVREHGLEPGRSVRELHRCILAADPTLDRLDMIAQWIPSSSWKI
ncbi:AfsR/SARP family transcriptional regulator [Nonomuraea sp. B12E4]|uniref:AfsR/SARP family transcriptional regulator n=1 Tax=Nonomuraea sp. B12E4 TaxID=3153564 RepID=UPI00325C6939